MTQGHLSPWRALPPSSALASSRSALTAASRAFSAFDTGSTPKKAPKALEVGKPQSGLAVGCTLDKKTKKQTNKERQKQTNKGI